MAIEAFAPAKINLALHVTGRRADGYHFLDSLVAFVDLGDRITAERADTLALRVTGSFADALSEGPENLVLRAARLFGGNLGAALTLDKTVPVASGVGGGSADAAATLQALAQLWGVPLPSDVSVLSLGADVPVCLYGRAARMTGVGEVIHPLHHPLPAASVVLANPGIAVSTPTVFAALHRHDFAPLPRDLPRLHNLAELAAFLGMLRNDLEPVAIALHPVIEQVTSALSAQPGCCIARMSGSGATCFGLFPDPLSAAAAARAITESQPGWWVAAAALRP